MESASVSSATRAAGSRLRTKRVVAAALGTAVEYYDLTVYGYLAVVISPIFFPGEDRAAAILATLSVFALAYLMRPIGGLFFGRLGDRRGRRTSLLVSVLLMGTGSLLMALLPTYGAAGIAAPILLVLARLVQGFSAGGEYGSAMTYVYESVAVRRRGRAASFLTIALFSGTAGAAAVVGLVSLLTTDQQMSAWGWRVPFLVGVPLVLLCLWMRKDLEDTSEFQKAADKGDLAGSTLRTLLRTHPKQLAQVAFLSTCQSGTAYMVLTYFVVHLEHVGHFDRTPVTWITAGVILSVALAAPLAGMLVDRFGPIRVSVAGLLVYAVLAYPTLYLMSGHGLLVASLAFLAYAMGTPLMQVAKDRLFPELFGPSLRVTGVALGFNIGTIISGGTAAYVCTWLVERTGNPRSPAYFVLLACVIGCVGLASVARDRSRREASRAEV